MARSPGRATDRCRRARRPRRRHRQPRPLECRGIECVSGPHRCRPRPCGPRLRPGSPAARCGRAPACRHRRGPRLARDRERRQRTRRSQEHIGAAGHLSPHGQCRARVSRDVDHGAGPRYGPDSVGPAAPSPRPLRRGARGVRACPCRHALGHRTVSVAAVPVVHIRSTGRTGARARRAAGGRARGGDSAGAWLALAQFEERSGQPERARGVIAQGLVHARRADADADAWWDYRHGGFDREGLAWLRGVARSRQ